MSESSQSRSDNEKQELTSESGQEKVNRLEDSESRHRGIFSDIIIIIIIRNLYSAIMPLGGYRGAGFLTSPVADELRVELVLAVHNRCRIKKDNSKL